MPRGSSPEKISLWRERLKRSEQSGLSVARFCQAEGVSQPSFYQWKKKLVVPANSSGDLQVARRKFRAVEVSSPAMSTSGSATIIRLARGVEIELGSDLRVVESIVKQLLALPSDSPPTGARSC